MTDVQWAGLGRRLGSAIESVTHARDVLDRGHDADQLVEASLLLSRAAVELAVAVSQVDDAMGTLPLATPTGSPFDP